MGGGAAIGALGGPMGAMAGAAYDSGKAERKAAKKVAAAQERAAQEAADALKNQARPAQAKVADAKQVAQRQAAQRASVAGIRSTYTAKDGGGATKKKLGGD